MIRRLDINTFIEISKSEGMAQMLNASWSNVIFKELKLIIVLYYTKKVYFHMCNSDIAMIMLKYSSYHMVIYVICLT